MEKKVRVKGLDKKVIVRGLDKLRVKKLDKKVRGLDKQL